MDNAKKEAAAAARREYYRRWRKANPDKVREYNRRYWQSVAEKEAKAQQIEQEKKLRNGPKWAN